MSAFGGKADMTLCEIRFCGRYWGQSGHRPKLSQRRPSFAQAAVVACGQSSGLSGSAYVGDPFLSVCFRRRRWLRRQLKYHCFLTAT
jgi:hypothetical protein